MQVVNYIAPDDHTGYACVARGYERLLRQQGIDVRRVPMRPGVEFGLWYGCGPAEGELAPDAPTILHCVPEYLPHLREWLTRRFHVRGPLIAMTVWETDRLPPHWPSLLNRMDAVIVPSSWNRDVFIRSGVQVPIHTLPHASEFAGLPAAPEAVERLRARLPAELRHAFLFYNVGAWNYRKGTHLLVRAFRVAFGGRKEAVLLLKTSAASEDRRSRLANVLSRAGGEERSRRRVMRGETPNVVAFTGAWSSEDMRALHTLGDAYATLTRGEGWGMGLYESVLFGKPCIAPREGGHRAYLPPGSQAGWVQGRFVPVRTPGKNGSYLPSQRWFQADVDDAACRMRQMVDRPALYGDAAAAAGTILRRTYSDAAIAEQLRHCLEQIE